jgi:hypothetical protein
MTKADFASCLGLSWGLVSEEAVHRAWARYNPGTRALDQELLAARGA